MSEAFSKKQEEIAGEDQPAAPLGAPPRELLEEQARRVPANLRKRFESAFAAWKAAWNRGGLAFHSDPRTRAVGKESDRLITMGPAILPLVVEKLADPENFFALQLYDALQRDPNLVVHIPPDDPRILEGEQGRARRVVQAWLAR
ncbi:MAG: hypothetical protein IRY99_02970 [Isosphaeraceae bacterium]|nr:hypothetical protein [Isosphaeraceae bacterium]